MRDSGERALSGFSARAQQATSGTGVVPSLMSLVARCLHRCRCSSGVSVCLRYWDLLVLMPRGGVSCCCSMLSLNAYDMAKVPLASHFAFA